MTRQETRQETRALKAVVDARYMHAITAEMALDMG